MRIIEKELESVKSKMFEMVDKAIEAVFNATESLKKSDIRLAQNVIDKDSDLDALELAIDEECIKILATKQPAAIDLRLVLAILKINTDLERIGDLATNIARETINMGGEPPIKPLVDIPRMMQISIEMIKDSFLAITEKRDDIAMKVIERDDEIDALNMQVFRELLTYMADSPNTISRSLSLIMAAKALERISDHATNIAEIAIYYIKGKDIRHQDA